MLLKNLNLALTTTVLLGVAGAAQASDNFVSRMVSAPDGAGRWANRRFTIRHRGQDAPKTLPVRIYRHEDNFLSRMATERDDRGRWLNRRFTLRHEGQDRPKEVL